MSRMWSDQQGISPAIAGTSGTAVSSTNKLVDNADLRLKQSIATLTDAATVTPDFATSNLFDLALLAATGSSRTLGNPSHLTVGQSGTIWFTQPATGGLSIVFDSYWMFPGKVAPQLTQTANAIDKLVYTVKSATFIDCDFAPNIGR